MIRRAFQEALRLPLFYKIVFANASIIVLAVAGGMLLSPGFGLVEPGHSVLQVAIPLGVAAVAACVLANTLIVRLALDPLRSLEEAAVRVRAGDLNARAPVSPLADPDLAHLIEVFNEVLDAAAGYRRRLRDSASRSLRAEEEERRRVARELHEATAQRLAGLLLRFRVLRPRCEAADEVEAILDEARAEVAGALEVVRGYALGRRPPSLDELGLGAAVESYARDVVPDHAVEVRVAPGLRDAEGLDPDVELALFRIVQEALDNVARHAGARRVEVEIDGDGGRVRATVTDDGDGFDVEAALASEDCPGLFEMAERAESVGGRFEVGPASGGGTRVEIVSPKRTPPGPTE